MVYPVCFFVSGIDFQHTRGVWQKMRRNGEEGDSSNCHVNVLTGVIASVARRVVLKFEKPSKIPHFHKFVSFDISIQRAKIPQIQAEIPHHWCEFLKSGGKSPYLATLVIAYQQNQHPKKFLHDGWVASLGYQ